MQLLIGQMIEKPIDQLTEYVSQQVIDNPALEVNPDGDSEWSDDGGEPQDIGEPQESRLDYDSDDIPVYEQNSPRQDPSDSLSFYDSLKEQMGTTQLTDRQRTIMEYLIGSLDNDGLLRKDIGTIGDEMAIYHNFDATEEEIADVLHRLQQFDPAGVGAQSLQQCLLLQVERRPRSKMRAVLRKLISNYFDDLLKNNWNRLQQSLHLSDEQKEEVRAEVRKLNPKPGAALGEVQGFSIQQVTPDFIVETTEDGQVTFSLRRGRLPALEVSEAYMETINNLSKLSTRDRESLPILRKDIDNAKMLIDALHQRQVTRTKTMAAIIRRQ